MRKKKEKKTQFFGVKTFVPGNFIRTLYLQRKKNKK